MSEFQMGIRPEHIVVGAASEQSIPARVEFFEYLGGTRFVHCVLEDGQQLVVEQRSGPDQVQGASIILDISSPHRLYFAREGSRIRESA